MTRISPSSVALSKQNLRKQMKQWAASHQKAICEASAIICSRLLAQDWWATSFQVGIYLSTPSEISTDPIQRYLLENGMRFAAPMWRGNGYVWSWVVETQTTGKTHFPKWKIGHFDLPEPSRFLPVIEDELRVIVVPGLAFDWTGNRLGRGGGYFDRLLAAAPHALRIALAMEKQVMEHIPADSHDIPMDAILTEKGFHFMNTAEPKLERLITGGLRV